MPPASQRASTDPRLVSCCERAVLCCAVLCRADRGALGEGPPAHADPGGGGHRWAGHGAGGGALRGGCWWGGRCREVQGTVADRFYYVRVGALECSCSCARSHPAPPWPAVCTTLSFSGSSAFTRLARKFDVVVVDEAAQVRRGAARRCAARGAACVHSLCISSHPLMTLLLLLSEHASVCAPSLGLSTLPCF